MGGVFSHSHVEKTFKKNQEYISEMNKNKVSIYFTTAIKIIDFYFIFSSDGTLDSDAVYAETKRKGSGNIQES